MISIDSIDVNKIKLQKWQENGIFVQAREITKKNLLGKRESLSNFNFQSESFEILRSHYNIKLNMLNLILRTWIINNVERERFAFD